MLVCVKLYTDEYIRVTLGITNVKENIVDATGALNNDCYVKKNEFFDNYFSICNDIFIHRIQCYVT